MFDDSYMDVTVISPKLDLNNFEAQLRNPFVAEAYMMVHQKSVRVFYRSMQVRSTTSSISSMIRQEDICEELPLARIQDHSIIEHFHNAYRYGQDLFSVMAMRDHEQYMDRIVLASTDEELVDIMYHEVLGLRDNYASPNDRSIKEAARVVCLYHAKLVEANSYEMTMNEYEHFLKNIWGPLEHMHFDDKWKNN